VVSPGIATLGIFHDTFGLGAELPEPCIKSRQEEERRGKISFAIIMMIDGVRSFDPISCWTSLSSFLGFFPSRRVATLVA
jgi:hypothetical protein